MNGIIARAERALSGEPAKAIRFGAVGFVGFLIDAGLVWLILDQDWTGPLIARVVSYTVAVSLTFSLHRAWTFQRDCDDGRDDKGRFARYLAGQTIAMAFNYAIYAALVLGLPNGPLTAVGAVAAGSAAAMIVNYAAARLWVFADR